MNYNHDWFNFVSGKVDEVLVRVKLGHGRSEMLTLKNERGFIKAVGSQPNGSAFIGCEVPLPVLRSDEYLAPAGLSLSNQRFWKVLRWRFYLEIAVYNSEALQHQTNALVQFMPRHLGAFYPSVGRFYLNTDAGRICVNRNMRDGDVSLSLEGVPPEHPLVVARRGQVVNVHIRRGAFQTYKEGTPEQLFVELLNKLVVPTTARQPVTVW